VFGTLCSAASASGRVRSSYAPQTEPVVCGWSCASAVGVSVMAIVVHEGMVWDAAAGRDPRREALDIEAAIGDALARNTRLQAHRITVTAGRDGLVTLTGTVSSQSLRREVELSCWTVPGVRSLHDNLIVGH
jgi:BON domain